MVQILHDWDIVRHLTVKFLKTSDVVSIVLRESSSKRTIWIIPSGNIFQKNQTRLKSNT